MSYVDDMVTEHLPLAKNIALAYCSRHHIAQQSWDDVTSDAQLGLLQAVRTFDPDRGFKFSTYASHVINGRILDGMRARGFLSRRDYHDARARAGYRSPLSMQMLDDIGGESWHPQLLEPGYQRADDHDEAQWLQRLAVETLEPRHAFVLLESIIHGRTLLDIAVDLGVTEARVCQMRMKALRELRRTARRRLATV